MKKTFRSFREKLELQQFQENYQGPPVTSGVFKIIEKYLEALQKKWSFYNFTKIIQDLH